MGMGALDELLDLPNVLGTGHFTSQERKRVLGQSGDFILEKHYQAELSSKISNMWSSFGPLRRVFFREQWACLGTEIHWPLQILLTSSYGLFVDILKFWNSGKRNGS